MSALSNGEPTGFTSAWLEVTQPCGPRGFWEAQRGTRASSTGVFSCMSKVTGMWVPWGREPCWPPPNPGVLVRVSELTVSRQRVEWERKQSAGASPAHQACASLSIHKARRPRPPEGDVFLCGLLNAPLGVFNKTEYLKWAEFLLCESWHLPADPSCLACLPQAWQDGSA